MPATDEGKTLMSNPGYLGPLRTATAELPHHLPVMIRDEAGGLYRLGEITLMGEIDQYGDARTLVLQAEEL